jgi:hypothetical protein
VTEADDASLSVLSLRRGTRSGRARGPPRCEHRRRCDPAYVLIVEAVRRGRWKVAQLRNRPKTLLIDSTGESNSRPRRAGSAWDRCHRDEAGSLSSNA